jgi:hypothetical protein
MVSEVSETNPNLANTTWIEVRAGRQKHERCSTGLDCLTHAGNLEGRGGRPIKPGAKGYVTAILARTCLSCTEFPSSDSQDSACTEASNSDRHSSMYSVPSVPGTNGTPRVK